jgi:hypothetical protein
MLRKANGIIDINSALTASIAALRGNGGVMFRVLICETYNIKETSGHFSSVSDLPHTKPRFDP